MKNYKACKETREYIPYTEGKKAVDGNCQGQ